MNGFDLPAIRARLDVREQFPTAVLDAADIARDRLPREGEAPGSRIDRTDVPFVTIDPEGSRDLDQAYFAETLDDRIHVLYAIADVGHFVDRGGPIEAEAFERGVTLYSPDTKTPLYPPVLSEGAASLLAGKDRPCILFSMTVANDGAAALDDIARAVVRSRAALSYHDVSGHLAAERTRPGSGMFAGNEWTGSVNLLETVGRRLQSAEAARGGVSLPISAQHVQRWSAAMTGYRLTFQNPDDVEGWNAQVSLMTGICAARVMCEHRTGLLRVLDPPAPDRLRALRLTARALGVAWPDGWTYAEFIRSLDPTRELHASIIFQAAGVMGGARYEAFEHQVPPDVRHAAIAAHYAHVTAPLRRLADRYALDLIVNLWRGGSPSEAELDTLRRLPALMQTATRRASSLESSIVDHAEASLLASSVGGTFRALVVRIRADRVTVQIQDPPVRADVPARSAFPDRDAAVPPKVSDDGSAILNGGERLALGDWLTLELMAADPGNGTVAFRAV